MIGLTNNQRNEIIIEYQLKLNKRLYEKNKITMEVYQKMNNYLIEKLKKIHTGI